MPPKNKAIAPTFLKMLLRATLESCIGNKGRYKFISDIVKSALWEYYFMKNFRKIINLFVRMCAGGLLALSVTLPVHAEDLDGDPSTKNIREGAAFINKFISAKKIDELQWWKNEYGLQFFKLPEFQSNIEDWVSSHNVYIVFPTHSPYVKGEPTIVDRSFSQGADIPLRDYLNKHGYSGDVEGKVETFTSNSKNILYPAPMNYLRIDRFIAGNKSKERVIHVMIGYRAIGWMSFFSLHAIDSSIRPAYYSFTSPDNDILVMVSWERSTLRKNQCDGKDIINGSCLPDLGFAFINYYYIEKQNSDNK